jgi:hypothetical protein
MSTFAKIFLAINGLVFLILGVRGIWDPVAHLALVEIVPSTPAAMAEARAMYGGASISLGLLFMYGAAVRSWLKPGLLVLAVFAGGLAAGRMLGAMLDGPASALTLQFLALEVGVTVVALWLRRRVKDDTF